jgi:hypothetical protein
MDDDDDDDNNNNNNNNNCYYYHYCYYLLSTVHRVFTVIQLKQTMLLRCIMLQLCCGYNIWYR